MGRERLSGRNRRVISLDLTQMGASSLSSGGRIKKLLETYGVGPDSSLPDHLRLSIV